MPVWAGGTGKNPLVLPVVTQAINCACQRPLLGAAVGTQQGKFAPGQQVRDQPVHVLQGHVGQHARPDGGLLGPHLVVFTPGLGVGGGQKGVAVGVDGVLTPVEPLVGLVLHGGQTQAVGGAPHIVQQLRALGFVVLGQTGKGQAAEQLLFGMAAPQGAQEVCAVKGWLIQGWSGSFRWLGERFEIASASKRFVVIFSIARNRTLSTTAFQRKINRKSRKKAEKKGRQRGSAFPLGGTDAINRNGPSCENAVQKRPQAFLNCQYKNFISAKYAQSNAEGILNRLFPHRGWSRGAGLMPFARCIAAGVAPLGQRVRGVFRLPPLSLWTPLSPGRVVAPSVCYGP